MWVQIPSKTFYLIKYVKVQDKYVKRRFGSVEPEHQKSIDIIHLV